MMLPQFSILDDAINFNRMGRNTTMPGQDHNAYITMPNHEFETAHCVYEHHLFTPLPIIAAPADTQASQLMYIGHCKLHEVFLYPDARRNSAWQKVFVKDAMLIIRVVFTSQSMIECQQRLSQLFKLHRPHCNTQGYKTTGRTMVVCNETGEEFGSILEAARAKGLSQSQLTNHVNGRAGFKTVKGLTFRRGFIGSEQQ